MLNINIILLRGVCQGEDNASSATLQKHSRVSVPCWVPWAGRPSGSRCVNKQGHSLPLWRHLIHGSKCNGITFFLTVLQQVEICFINCVQQVFVSLQPPESAEANGTLRQRDARTHRDGQSRERGRLLKALGVAVCCGPCYCPSAVQNSVLLRDNLGVPVSVWTKLAAKMWS